MVNKAGKLMGEKENADLLSSANEFEAKYIDELYKSIQEAETGQNLVSFTMYDFLAYTPSKL